MSIGDEHDWTPGEACRDAAVEADKQDADACICILLKRGPKGTKYDTTFRNSGLSTTELIALLEVIKFDALNHLRGREPMSDNEDG